VLASIGRGGRGRRDGAEGGLTGARAVAKRWRNGGGGGWRKKCVARALECGRKLESEGRRCGRGWGSLGVYIGGRGNTREG
jgi:hypothetical protein